MLILYGGKKKALSTLSTQTWVRSVSIQPLGEPAITAWPLNSCNKIFVPLKAPLETIMGFNFVSSALAAKQRNTRDFLGPVVFMVIIFLPHVVIRFLHSTNLNNIRHKFSDKFFRVLLSNRSLSS